MTCTHSGGHVYMGRTWLPLLSDNIVRTVAFDGIPIRLAIPGQCDYTDSSVRLRGPDCLCRIIYITGRDSYRLHTAPMWNGGRGCVRGGVVVSGGICNNKYTKQIYRDLLHQNIRKQYCVLHSSFQATLTSPSPVLTILAFIFCNLWVS